MRNFFRLVGFLLEFTFLAIVFNGVVKGQHHGEVGSIQGKVVFQNIPIQGASVVILSSSRGYVTDVQGNFHFDNLALGRYQLRISYIGFKPYQKEVEIKEKGEVVILNINLEEEILPLNPIEVTASRGVTFSEQSTVTVSRISKRTFDITQALNLAESLNFSPGLRIENNCQNCGFTQLRMLGLGGAYSQILINNRPIFSALAGVYGLEMLPSNMIERVEIVRGGGSVLYGSNAIAGIVNIITQQPQESGFEIGMNQAFTQFQVPDRTINASVTLAGEKGQGGASFYAFQRNRSPFDANADGFSEIPMLKNTTLGFEYAATLSQLQKIKAGVYSIQEFRRGGNQFDLPPHQATLAEQLEHSMGGAHIAYEKFSYNLRHKWTLYASGQSTIRNSYYGSGGRILSLQDTLTMQDILALNAYGNTKDWAGISGLQYSFQPSKLINSLLVGLEYYSNWVQDKIPGYGRKIDQKTGTLGFFSQLEIKPLRPLLVTTGIRLDFFHLRGQFFWSIYHTTAQSMATSILVPKLSVLYNLTSEIKLRASYTQGYRAPQAFDEDLHLETVGGAARFTELAKELAPERAHSLLASFQYNRIVGKVTMSYLFESFFTYLSNPFILSRPIQLPNGLSVIQKRNGKGATVQGFNLELNAAFSQKYLLQLGLTIQGSNYHRAEVIWEPPQADSSLLSTVTTTRFLKTPSTYGFIMLFYSPWEALSFSLSGVFTGPMEVPHVVNPANEYTVIRKTPAFLELNFKVKYQLAVFNKSKIEFWAGIQNITNSYQKDFDRGPLRDAGYIYGPARPRGIFAGWKYIW